jgi:hypothetical protein
MRSNKQHEDPGGRRDNFAEKNEKLAMAMLVLVLMIFLVGVTSVLALHLWPNLFGRILFSSR